MGWLDLLATCSLLGLYYFDLVITRELHEYNGQCVLLVDRNLLDNDVRLGLHITKHMDGYMLVKWFILVLV